LELAFTKKCTQPYTFSRVFKGDYRSSSYWTGSTYGKKNFQWERSCWRQN
jgi:hypothetical protein